MNAQVKELFSPSRQRIGDPNNPLGMRVEFTIRIRDWYGSGLGITIVRRRGDGRRKTLSGLVGEIVTYMDMF